MRRVAAMFSSRNGQLIRELVADAQGDPELAEDFRQRLFSHRRVRGADTLAKGNKPYELVHIGGRGTRQRMDLGTLGVVAARIAGPKEAVTFVGLEAAGRIRKLRGWLEWDVSTFRVDSGGPIEIGIDGEAMLLDPPLIFESLPGELRVRIPTHAPGVAPAGAAVQLTGSTIGDLILTAAGRRLEGDVTGELCRPPEMVPLLALA
jgi:hypothetical protein